MGLVHGLAGSAAVALLVALATIRDPRWACAYLLVFALGTMLRHGVRHDLDGAPLAPPPDAGRPSGTEPRLTTGGLSLALGAPWLIYRIGWVDGLFGGVPNWHPH